VQVRYTSRAERDIVVRDEWWRANRPASPDLFWDELSVAIETIAAAPYGAPLYVARRSASVRRLLLRGSSCHVYFRVDRRRHWVMVLAVWGAQRARGPSL
jgi:plasmid stabilization system protein ParE